MEDQSTDSSDLNADAATASVPQGKAARSRHRLPRQKVRQSDSSGATTTDETASSDAVLSTTVEDESPAETVEERAAETVAEPVLEEPVTEDPKEPAPEAVSTTKTRRRGPWRRSKKADEPANDSAIVESADGESAVDESDGDQPEAATGAMASDEPEPVLVPHRTAGRALKLVAVAAAVLFVAAGAFAGATVQPYFADRAAVYTKFQIAETAANAITTLWTYTPEDMDKLPDRSARYLGGDFAADYRRYIDAIVEPNKQAQITNNTQVLGAAVESLSPTEATAIVYTNSLATSPVTKGIPSLRYLSYRLSMKRDGSRWLITQMVAVTKLDLTPQL